MIENHHIPLALREGRRWFDLHSAVFLAELSKLAYARDEEIVKWIALRKNQSAYQTFSVANHQAIALVFDKFSVISFRGTEKNFSDIRTDIDTNKVQLASGSLAEVHDGFNKGAEALAPLISGFIFVHKLRDKHVYFTGHSLGGGLAQLCAFKLRKTLVRAPIVYSFGSPRVGNKIFKIRFDHDFTHHRIVNASDIVPNLPTMSMGFTHSGQHHYITSAGDLESNPGFWWQLFDQWRDVAGGIVRGFSGKTPVRRFTRHRIDEYIDRLHALEGRNGG